LSDRTYTVAGISTKQGQAFYRVANGTAEARQRVLERDRHTSIDLRDLPKPMTRDEAIAWLTNLGVNPGAKATQEAKVVPPTEPVAAEPRKRRRGAWEWAVGGDDEFPIGPPSHPANEIEAVARRIHKRDGVMRWLAWDHLTKVQKAAYISQAKNR
jgi:hypothetical protein